MLCPHPTPLCRHQITGSAAATICRIDNSQTLRILLTFERFTCTRMRTRRLHTLRRYIMTRPHRVEHNALISVVCLSVRLSVPYMTLMEEHSKLKIGRKETHDTGYP